MAKRIPWTNAQVNKLIRLHTQGLSSRDVAKQLNTTRGSVLGKLRRLRESSVEFAQATKPKPKRKPKKPKPKPKPKLKPPPAPVELFNLKPDQCHWIDPAQTTRPLLYSCHNKCNPQANQYYCEEHSRRVYVSPTRAFRRNNAHKYIPDEDKWK